MMHDNPLVAPQQYPAYQGGMLAADFALAVSVSDLVTYSADEEHISANARLEHVLSLLGVRADLMALHEQFLATAPMQGDMHVFSPSAGGRNLFALNMLRDPHDQLDVIGMAIRCEPAIVVAVRDALRTYFDSAQYQIHYEQGNVLERVLDVSSDAQFAAMLTRRGISQKLIRHPATAG